MNWLHHVASTRISLPNIINIINAINNWIIKLFDIYIIRPNIHRAPILLSAEALVDLAWSLASNNVTHHPLLLHLERSISYSDFSPQQLANMSWEFARLRRKGHMTLKSKGWKRCTHRIRLVLLYMVCHGSHQYTPFMLALIYQHHGSYGVWDGFIGTP